MEKSLLNLVKQDHRQPPRIIVMGGEGIGKSTLASNAPKPIFIQTEDSLSGIHVDGFPLTDDFATVLSYLDTLLYDDHDYKTCVVDSADWLDQIILNDVLTGHNVEKLSEIGYGDGWMLLVSHWKTVLECCDKLRKSRGMIIIFTAHTEIRKSESPMHGSFDKVVLKLDKKTRAILEEWADIILHCDYDMVVKSEKSGFQDKGRAISKGDRIMHTVGSPSFTAKNRFNLPEVLPLDWQAFQSAYAESIKQKESDNGQV